MKMFFEFLRAFPILEVGFILAIGATSVVAIDSSDSNKEAVLTFGALMIIP